MSTNNLQPAASSATMSGMRTNTQTGFINGMGLALIGVGIALITAVIFGAWAFAERQDYKNNTQEKIDAAVVTAKDETKQVAAAQYAEESKNPLKTHVGPDSYGSVTVQYPKTWSAYVQESNNNSGVAMNSYFHPDVVPNTQTLGTAYALRMQVVSTSYNQIMTQYNALAQNKKVTVTPYKLPKVPSVLGARVDGQITTEKRGTMIVLPLRNVTLQISTESSDYLSDFDKIILPNLSFSP